MLKKDAQKIEGMFSAIAPRYDMLNRVLSAGIDRRWRKKGIRALAPGKGGVYLDIAAGTGDLSLEIRKQQPDCRVLAADFSHGMLEIALKKTEGKEIAVLRADALKMPFPDGSFDGITCAFGIRNFEVLEDGLKEILRTLKPGGTFMALEFTTPTTPLMKSFYSLYFTRILPVIGKALSGHSEAYTYLPRSAFDFPDRGQLARIFKACGFENVSVTPLTFGVCDMAMGQRPVE